MEEEEEEEENMIKGTDSVDREYLLLALRESRILVKNGIKFSDVKRKSREETATITDNDSDDDMENVCYSLTDNANKLICTLCLLFFFSILRFIKYLIYKSIYVIFVFFIVKNCQEKFYSRFETRYLCIIL